MLVYNPQHYILLNIINRAKIPMKNNPTDSPTVAKQKVTTADYILVIQLREQKLFFNLQITGKPKIANNDLMADCEKINNKKYSGIFPFQSLHPQIKANFKDLNNLLMYLVEPQNIQVNTGTGKIDIVINADLPNGQKIKFGNSGSIQLHEHNEDDDIIENMENIVKICESDKQLSQIHFKTLIKGLAKAISHIQIQQSKKQDISKVKSINNHPPTTISNNAIQVQLNSSMRLINDIKKDLANLKQNEIQNNKKYTQLIQNCRKQSRDENEKNRKQVKQENNYLIGGFKIQLNQQIRKLEKNLANITEQVKQISKKIVQNRQTTEKTIKSDQNGNQQIELFKKVSAYSIQKIKQFEDIYDAKINQIHDTLNQVTKQTGTIVQILYYKNLYPNLEKTSSSSQVTYRLGQELNKIQKQFNAGNNLQKQIKAEQKKEMFLISNKNENNLLSFKKTDSTYSSIPSLSSWSLLPTLPQSHELQYLDKSSKFYDKFVVQKNTIITYKGLDKKSTILMGRTPISQRNQFKIKIIKTSGRAIGFGVADSTYKTQRQIRNLPNFIQYWAYDGSVWEGPSKEVKSEGGGIKQGETVIIKVGLKMGAIQWIVQGKLRASMSTSKFMKSNINWVPLIVMQNTEDCIEWIPIK